MWNIDNSREDHLEISDGSIEMSLYSDGQSWVVSSISESIDINNIDVFIVKMQEAKKLALAHFGPNWPG
jgi:hypothetical protein